MKNIWGILSGLTLSIVSSFSVAASDFYKYTNYNPIAAENSIEFTQFTAPKGKARPQTWWHWINGNVSREGIDKDLKAMSENGYGAAIIFSIYGAEAGKLNFGSREWFDNFKFTVDTAAKYGMEIGIHNCDGWSEAGGKWIEPQDSMKGITWTLTTVEGNGKEQVLKLPKPNSRLNFYKDIAVVAWKSQKPDELSMLKTLKAILPANKNTAFGGERKSMCDSSFDSQFTLSAKDGNTSYGVVLEFSEPFTASGAAIAAVRDWSFESPVFIEVSDDGKNFEAVATLDILSTSGIVKFPSKSARFWRIMRYAKSEKSQPVKMSNVLRLREFELVDDGSLPKNFSQIDGMRIKAALDNFYHSSYTRKDSVIDVSGIVKAEFKKPVHNWQ